MSNDPLPDNERYWNEGDTPVIEVILLDGSGVPIPLSNIITLTLSQWIENPRGLPGTTINSRKLQNVLNANGVTVDPTSGTVEWQLTAADTAMQTKDTLVLEERHNFQFAVTYHASGTIEAGNWVDWYAVARTQVLK